MARASAPRLMGPRGSAKPAEKVARRLRPVRNDRAPSGVEHASDEIPPTTRSPRVAEISRDEEVLVRSAPRLVAAAPTGPFEVVLVTGEVVRVPASFDPAALARLLDVLAKARGR
jgi:hypothetical protein